MVFRILNAAKCTSGVSGRYYYNICRILSESGILFALSSVLNLIALVLDTNPYTLSIAQSFPRTLFNVIVRPIHLVCSSGANECGAECFHGWYCIQPHSYPRRTRTHQYEKYARIFAEHKAALDATIRWPYHCLITRSDMHHSLSGRRRSPASGIG